MDEFTLRYRQRLKELREEQKPINQIPRNSVFSIRAFIDDRRKSWNGNNWYTSKTDREIVIEKDWLAGCDGQPVYETIFGASSEIAVKDKRNGKEYIVAQNWTVPKTSFKPFPVPEVAKKAKSEDVRIAKEAYDALIKMGYIPDPKECGGRKKKGGVEFEDFLEDYLDRLGKERHDKNAARDEFKRSLGHFPTDEEWEEFDDDYDRKNAKRHQGRGSIMEDFIDEVEDDFFDGDDVIPF